MIISNISLGPMGTMVRVVVGVVLWGLVASTGTARAQGVEPKRFANSIGMEFVTIPGGTFTMGDQVGNGQDNEQVLRKVRLESFSLGLTEVTQAQYEKVMGTNPSAFQTGETRGTRPAEQVTWFDAVGFCNALSIKEGKAPFYNLSGGAVAMDKTADGYRLPSEAEWEYAAKGGASGARTPTLYAGGSEGSAVGWTAETSGFESHPVGGRMPNQLGLYDLSGNVAEWVGDWYGDYDPQALESPVGPTTGTERVIRGGNWFADAYSARVSQRSGLEPSRGYDFIGFRVSLPGVDNRPKTGSVAVTTKAGGTLRGGSGQTWTFNGATNRILNGLTSGEQTLTMTYTDGKTESITINVPRGQEIPVAFSYDPRNSVQAIPYYNLLDAISKRNINLTVNRSKAAEGRASNSGLSFSGNNEYIKGSMNSDFPTSNSPRTISLWVKQLSLNKGGNILFCYGSPDDKKTFGITYGVDAKTKKPSVMVFTWGVDIMFWSNDLLNRWANITVTFDRTMTRVYVDGKKLGEANMQSINTAKNYFVLGSNMLQDWNQYTPMIVDDLRIYSRALTDSEVIDLTAVK